MERDLRALSRNFNVLAAVVSAAVTISLPLIYFALSYSNLLVTMDTAAEINGRLVSDVINANPELWRFEDHKLSELLARRHGGIGPGRRRILDEGGAVVAQGGPTPAPPVITRSEPLMDAGVVVGRIEISRSLRPILLDTALIAAAGLFLGLTVFAVLRVLPLRDLRRTLDVLFRETERAQVTLRSIGDGVIATNLSGQVAMINPAAEALTGWTETDARMRPVGEVFRIVDGKSRAPCENPAETVLRSGEAADRAGAILLARDGAERIVPVSASPIHDRAGHVIGTVLVFRDETEKTRAEQELLRAEKLDSIGMLAGGIAHDFNNLLTSILGNLSLVELYGKAEGRTFEKIGEVRKACLRARDLTNQFLAFSKGGAPVKQAGSIAEVLREAAVFALAGSKSRCEFAIAEDTAAVEIDVGQMSQVIQNLVINADHAMAGGGAVRIRTENVEVAEADGIPVAPGRYVRISIKDDGCGIPPENLSKIFEPYYTTKSRGSGLGLATSYFIVKNHGGHISVQSTVGVGTTFRIYLPATAKAPPSEVESEAKPVSGKGKVLVMDDEKGVRDVAAEMLAHFGYEVALSADGAEALRLYLEARAAGAPFDAVIMDLTIPGGMGGKETIRRMLEADPGVRAIVSSGYSNDPVMAEYASYGFKGVVAKPYRIEDLCRVLRDVIGAPGSVPAGRG